jgi:prepilin-type N-terminal cleavage/methylation domain-containing protein/prepilin-type processing-associated H-X9-DG protein
MRGGFTLTELIVSLSVISVLAGIMLPVVTKARGKARQAVCLSNMYQLGMAIQMYQQDADDTLPSGFSLRDPSQADSNGALLKSSGVGWAGLVYSYVRNDRVFVCPDDLPATGGLGPGVSYAFNSNLAGYGASRLESPSRSVLLFEIEGVPADPRLVYPDTPGYYSAAGNGVPRAVGKRLGCSDRASRTACLGMLADIAEPASENAPAAAASINVGSTLKMATGYLGGQYDESSIPPMEYASPKGRHDDGSNYLFSDGHVKWAPGSRISPGAPAGASFCNQATDRDYSHVLPQPRGCPPPFPGDAAGTDQRNRDGTSEYDGTFSPT